MNSNDDSAAVYVRSYYVHQMLSIVMDDFLCLNTLSPCALCQIYTLQIGSEDYQRKTIMYAKSWSRLWTSYFIL